MSIAGIGGGLQGAAGVINGINSILNIVHQIKMMDIYHQIKKDTIKGEREISEIEKKGMLEGLKRESSHNARMAELSEKAMNAKVERSKAEGEMSETDHEMKEKKITEKMSAKSEDNRLKNCFRNKPSYGDIADERYS